MKNVHMLPLARMSYPMLRLSVDCFLERWEELAGSDIYQSSNEIKETAELLSDLFNELAKRLPA
jgi:hypothetical protein